MPAVADAPTFTATSPAGQRVTVRVVRSEIEGDVRAEVAILDALGREVLTQAVETDEARFDVSGLAPGVYVVRVVTEGGASTRLVVTR